MGVIRTCRRRLKRSRMMTRTELPVTGFPNEPLVVASHPTLLGSKTQIQVEMISLKQGTFNDQPASFLLFDISQSMQNDVRQLKYDFEISNTRSSSTGHTRQPGASFSLVAYAPAHLFKPPYTIQPLAPPEKQPAAVKIERTTTGFTFVITKGKDADSVPRRLKVAFIVAHTDSLLLTVFPSFPLLNHIMSFRRNIISPFALDLAMEFRPVMTCARADQDCHPTCCDFGPEHMSPELWIRTLACPGLRGYMGNLTPDVSTLLCRTSLADCNAVGGLHGSVRAAALVSCCNADRRLPAVYSV